MNPRYWILPLSFATSDAGLLPLADHVDVHCHYHANAWSYSLRIDDDDNPYAPAEVFLPLSDKPYVSGNPGISGARNIRPANPVFSFTGVEPGEPLWIAVQGSPGPGEAWPGFDNTQAPSTFGSYIPNDVRLSQTTPFPWIRISLVNYESPHGTHSHFSMWTTSTGRPPTVWMSTFQPETDNAYYFVAGNHTHMAWGFTAMGIHRITLRASAYRGPGATNPTAPGPPFTLQFAVGTVARWQAESFNAAQLADSSISSLAADPDSDGQPNLIEYAFGTHPLKGGAAPVEAGLGMPVFSITEQDGTLYQTLTYPRRRQGERLRPEIYQPLFADSVAGPWTDAGVTTTTTDFPPSQARLNDGWELAISKRPLPAGARQGFARVAVTAGD
jgi:surface-anchored protein